MSAEAFRIIDDAMSRPRHDLRSANDRPGDMPPDVEARAVEMFQASTNGLCGTPWNWEESDEAIRNIWRLKAFKLLYILGFSHG